MATFNDLVSEAQEASYDDYIQYVRGSMRLFRNTIDAYIFDESHQEISFIVNGIRFNNFKCYDKLTTSVAGEPTPVFEWLYHSIAVREFYHPPTISTGIKPVKVSSPRKVFISSDTKKIITEFVEMYKADNPKIHHIVTTDFCKAFEKMHPAVSTVSFHDVVKALLGEPKQRFDSNNKKKRFYELRA